MLASLTEQSVDSKKRGQTTVEYALMVGFAVFVFSLFRSLVGPQINSVLSTEKNIAENRGVRGDHKSIDVYYYSDKKTGKAIVK